MRQTPEPTSKRHYVAGITDDTIVFGAFMPQGWKMELAAIEGAEAKWIKAVEIAVLAEELGYDSIWVYDHVHNVPRPAHEAVFECWTTMAAISQLTSRMRLGQMVGCNSYRSPALLAKITSNVDVISGGRLDWGIGAGWYENEYRGYGYDFPKPKDRIGMLRETVEIVKTCGPSPRRQAASTTRLSRQLRPEAAAGPAPAGVDRRRRRAAHAAGRRPPRRLLELRRQPGAVGAQARGAEGALRDVGRDEARSARPGHPRCSSAVPRPRSLPPGAQPVGRAGRELAGQQPRRDPRAGLREDPTYVDLGCRGFIPWCADYPDTETLDPARAR